MTIEVGDTVQFTASSLLALRQMTPDLYATLIDSGRIGGPVLHIDSEGVTVDVSPEVPVPITISSNRIENAIQLVHKGKPNQQVCVEGGPIQLTYEQSQREQHHPDCQNNPTNNQLPWPPSLIGYRPQLINTTDEPPSQIRLSQWVVLQILHMKQHAIVQDLNRITDEDSPSDTTDKHIYRPVKIELSPMEEKLYNVALQRIGNWISAGSDNKQTHPEVSNAAPAPEVDVGVQRSDDLQE